MQNFIVLGLVPGTDFQITFTTWAYAILVFWGVSLLRYAWRRRGDIHVALISLQIALVIDRGQVRA